MPSREVIPYPVKAHWRWLTRAGWLGSGAAAVATSAPAGAAITQTARMPASVSHRQCAFTGYGMTSLLALCSQPVF
ncbi:MAG TPA: hypothetical protein VHR86_09210, partial [Armatimonadota bacterium]|nr:hypothetical protein [Armatimonadota bacterium]